MAKEPTFPGSNAAGALRVFFVTLVCGKFIPNEIKGIIENFLKKFPKIWHLEQKTLWAIVYYLCINFVVDQGAKMEICRCTKDVTNRSFTFSPNPYLETVFMDLNVFESGGLSREDIHEIQTAVFEQKRILGAGKEVKS